MRGWMVGWKDGCGAMDGRATWMVVLSCFFSKALSFEFFSVMGSFGEVLGRQNGG